MVFLRPDAVAGGSTEPDAEASGRPEVPLGGSRRAKGGSLWLAEQGRRRADERQRAGGSQAKHCWVVDPRWPGRHAGLLLGWERTEDGWRGRVALAPDADAELVVALVAAPYLEPPVTAR